MDYSAPLYQHPQEVWDEAKCRKLASRKSESAPFKGYIGSSASIPPAYGAIRYNGGCEREGQWWQGEIRPLPVVADGYEIVIVPTWGWRIKRINEA